MGGRQIRVNAIAPGGTETEGAQQAGFLGSNMEKQMIAATPLGNDFLSKYCKRFSHRKQKDREEYGRYKQDKRHGENESKNQL